MNPTSDSSPSSPPPSTSRIPRRRALSTLAPGTTSAPSMRTGGHRRTASNASSLRSHAPIEPKTATGDARSLGPALDLVDGQTHELGSVHLTGGPRRARTRTRSVEPPGAAGLGSSDSSPQPRRLDLDWSTPSSAARPCDHAFASVSPDRTALATSTSPPGRSSTRDLPPLSIRIPSSLSSANSLHHPVASDDRDARALGGSRHRSASANSSRRHDPASQSSFPSLPYPSSSASSPRPLPFTERPALHAAPELVPSPRPRQASVNASRPPSSQPNPPRTPRSHAFGVALPPQQQQQTMIERPRVVSSSRGGGGGGGPGSTLATPATYESFDFPIPTSPVDEYEERLRREREVERRRSRCCGLARFCLGSSGVRDDETDEAQDDERFGRAREPSEREADERTRLLARGQGPHEAKRDLGRWEYVWGEVVCYAKHMLPPVLFFVVFVLVVALFAYKQAIRRIIHPGLVAEEP
ncbi:hypothetical protein JCM10212_001658 [Sporobolomyces blumeae]